ncbi:Mus7/MMS22 family-domain-containing protein [Nemania sp. NC0429]|nr:Mus7/MMS22 family-domain-containing protein [Nemania sp. NC0429]
MAKWKELGEVPDSDDESTWDSQESLLNPPALELESAREPAQEPAPADTARDAAKGTSEAASGVVSSAVGKESSSGQAVWDVPFSSPISVDEQEVPPSPRQPDGSELSSPNPASPVDEHQPETTSPAPPSLLKRRYEIQIILPIDGPDRRARGRSEGSPLSSLASFSEHSKGTTSEAQQLPIIVQEDETGTNEYSRLGRSLRPRKPIQEHPYLLESVQYSKTWKSHGLRPVRVLAEHQKKGEDEDSQEQAFEDDSQIVNKDITQEETEESQQTGSFPASLERDGLLLSDQEEPSPTPTPEPAPALPGRNIQSSQQEDEEEEFPDPNDVEKWKSNKAVHRVRKRRSSPKVSHKRKLPRLSDSAQVARNALVLPDIDDIFDIPVSPPQTSPGVLATTPMAVINRLEGNNAFTLTPKQSSDVSSRIQSPAPTHHHSELIDLTLLDDQDSEDDSDVPSYHGGSENEPDRVLLGARRIRGVLPASWLRLDQQASLQKPRPTVRQRSPGISPERSVRKGVAQRRPALPQLGSSSALFLSDDSDDSDSFVRPQEPDISLYAISTSAVNNEAASVMEEDHIDSMFSRSKRANTDSIGPRRKRKRSQQSMFDGRPGQRKRQQRITGLLGRTESIGSARTGRLQPSKDSRGAQQSEKRNQGKRKPTISRPPRLGILDVVEPNAPAFIRIAARTTRTRRDHGRSSPSKKVIMLGTRQDTIDAVGVLKSWNEGKIQPRTSVSFSSRRHTRQREEVETTSQPHDILSPEPTQTRTSRGKSSARFSQPRRMVKQASMDPFVVTGPRSPHHLSFYDKDSLVEKPRSHSSVYRPAQLEMPSDTANPYMFDAQKRALDALYRRSRKSLSAPRNSSLEQSINRQTPVDTNHQPATEKLRSPEHSRAPALSKIERRAKFRKQTRPQLVDVSAPQYIHANDPLPREDSPPTGGLDIQKEKATGKLLGLAPYGTHYTQHFEVFPLDRGVFFHESTILGSGRLKRALDSRPLGNLSGHRGRCTFTIGERTLSWGTWDAETSSELGIVFDWMIDRLDGSSGDDGLGTTTPVQAADFVLNYLQDHLTLIDPESSNIFTGRIVDVLQAVERRLKETPDNSGYAAQLLIEVLTRILVIAVQSLRFCQRLNKVSEAFQMEDILKRLAMTTAKVLLRTDLKEVRRIYNRLQEMSFREKGIQNDEHSVICWVTLIRILEEAGIPRAGFLGVISTLLSESTEHTFDVTVLEQAWRNLFTLLPLGEFDSAGVAIPGMRHKEPLEGWIVPQRLLRRVFQVYQSNSRQSPSFNDYLRAVASRCHYLVEQWGWYKCNTILGTIFDFFAAQDLHNLRNEEVYQSPQFLDDLAGSPSLATSPGDRCFHIYLKLIAMSIKRLKKVGMMKEIKNLVARLLPNHSRQHDKMMETHEADIAALRNHHDLLCTLYWAAPPDMRPSTQSIEGLVNLGSSHKEACLISLRTWSRLSKFVVASSQDISAYKPLADWQKNISQQVLEQFLSVETEVDQQLLGMSAEACKTITQYQKNAVISQNRRVAMDLLHFSMKSFLDTMRHSQTLSTASFVLNNYPLEQILTRLSFSSASSDWGILQVVLDITDYFLSRIDAFTSTEPLHAGQSWHEEDAIMLLERKIAVPFISVVRGVVNMKPQDVVVGQVGDHDLCATQAVALASRLAACLIHARLARLRQFFQAGKYSLFQDLSRPRTSAGRKYVALFIATMADRGVTDFKDLGLTPLDFFLAELVKPLECLAYENRLAMSFKRIGEAYLENAAIEVGSTPDYRSNKYLFNCTVVSMRRALLRADTSQKSHLQAGFFKALRFTMDRIKADLKSMVLNSPEHLDYVEFVRSIISLIRSQDLCPVDSFFYQISQEYSPSSQDPRLQTAGILSWGLKLEEGDTKAVSGLFYLLFPSFKIALASGELRNEVNILKESMEHVQVFDFMMGTMLPAIIKTVTQVSHGWVLLDTYVEAVDARLSSACIHRQIGGGIMRGILALHIMVLAGIGNLQAKVLPDLRNEEVVSLTAMIKLLNFLSPSVTAYLMNEPEGSFARDLTPVIDELTNFARAADGYLSSLAMNRDEDETPMIEPRRLFEGLAIPESGWISQQNHQQQIDQFSNHMLQDIRGNWVSNESYITVKAPSRTQQRPSSTQSGQGTPIPRWERREVLAMLREQIRTWSYAHDVMMTKTASYGALLDEFMF